MLLSEDTFLSQFTWICFGISVVALLLILAFDMFKRMVPFNYLALGSYTVSFSVVLAAICSTAYDIEYGPSIVLSSALFTLAIALILTMYAFTCEHDFTMIGFFIK